MFHLNNEFSWLRQISISRAEKSSSKKSAEYRRVDDDLVVVSVNFTHELEVSRTEDQDEVSTVVVSARVLGVSRN